MEDPSPPFTRALGQSLRRGPYGDRQDADRERQPARSHRRAARGVRLSSRRHADVDASRAAEGSNEPRRQLPVGYGRTHEAWCYCRIAPDGADSSRSAARPHRRGRSPGAAGARRRIPEVDRDPQRRADDLASLWRDDRTASGDVRECRRPLPDPGGRSCARNCRAPLSWRLYTASREVVLRRSARADSDCRGGRPSLCESDSLGDARIDSVRAAASGRSRG